MVLYRFYTNMTAIVKRSDDFILPGWKQKTKTENDWRGPYIPTTNTYTQYIEVNLPGQLTRSSFTSSNEVRGYNFVSWRILPHTNCEQ